MTNTTDRKRSAFPWVMGLLLLLCLMAGCTEKSPTGNEITPSLTETSKPTTVSPAPTASKTPIPTITPTPVPTVMVDGYDLTKALSGTSLKEAYADYFKIGVGLNGSGISTDTVKSEAMREIIKYQFNSTTYSNLMKPSYLLDQAKSKANIKNGIQDPAVKFDSVIAGLDFCKENGIGMRGHTLVWHTQVPDWFFKMDYDSEAPYVDRDTMLYRMESYIKQVLTFVQTEYPGVVYCWDVVNEAVEVVSGNYEKDTGYQIRTASGDGANLWYTVVGTDYVEKAFTYARKYADPDVKLFYNDYNTFQIAKTNCIYKLVSHLKELGLIDGIGMQSYMSLTYPGLASGNSSVYDALLKFGELGLEVQLTELTISSDDKTEASMEKQAKRYQTLFTLLKALDTDNGGTVNITSVTVFGLMDEYLFYSNNKEYSRLFDGQLQPKPAYYAILSAAGIEE